MAETKRVPTEMEAKLLLRAVAKKMEDEAAVGAYASGAWLRASRMVFLFVFILGMVGLPFLDRSVPFAVWGALAGLMAVVADQSIEIGRLTRATTALARTAMRARDTEPLPRAPSPHAPAAE